MTNLPPAVVGQPLAEVETPALVIDLGAFERNLARMAEGARAAGLALRPHAKTHKSALIAARQIALGAVGVCCQKVGEAEAMVAGGVRDVLVSNQIVGARKLPRLAALAREARIDVCVDDGGNVAALDAAAAEAGARIGVLVEIDVGAGRCGVAPGEAALRLADRIADSAHLRFEGLQAYHGRAQHIRDFGERRDAIRSAAQLAGGTRDLLQRHGIDCPRVTGAGTGTWRFEAESGVFTELQCGSYVFMDVDYARNLAEDGRAAPEFEQSLYVLATVMSRPTAERAVLDAGLKALSVDSGLPRLADVAAAEYVGASDEHGTLRLIRPANDLHLGDKVRLVPGHCDPTVNLYDWYVAVRDGRVEALWPVDARGAVT